MQKDILSKQASILREQAAASEQCGLPPVGLRAYEQNLDAFLQAGDASPAEKAALLEESSLLHQEWGGRAAAQARLEQALGLYRSMEGPHLMEEAEALRQLGSLHREQGEEQKALAYCEESLATLGKLPASEPNPRQVMALKQIGSLYYEMDHHTPALRCFETALDLTAEYTPALTTPMKLEAAAIATLSAAIQMEQALEGQEARGGRNAAQFISLAEQYLEGLDGSKEGALVERRQEGLNSLKEILKGML